MASSNSIRASVRALRRWAAVCILAASAPLVLGAPISADPVAGLPGEFVTTAVRDGAVVGFEGADLAFTFDPLVLSLVDISPGPAFPGAVVTLGAHTSLPGGLEQVLLSLAIGNGPFDGTDVTMFLGHFQIQAGAAPGFTTIHFETLDASVYDIDLDASVRVLAAQTVPEAGTGWLVLAAGGGLLLVAARRRRAA